MSFSAREKDEQAQNESSQTGYCTRYVRRDPLGAPNIKDIVEIFPHIQGFESPMFVDVVSFNMYSRVLPDDKQLTALDKYFAKFGFTERIHETRSLESKRVSLLEEKKA